MPVPDVRVEFEDMLNAQSNASAQQIAALLRRNAELEALAAALRRRIGELQDRLAVLPDDDMPHPKPRAVGDG